MEEKCRHPSVFLFWAQPPSQYGRTTSQKWCQKTENISIIIAENSSAFIYLMLCCAIFLNKCRLKIATIKRTCKTMTLFQWGVTGRETCQVTWVPFWKTVNRYNRNHCLIIFNIDKNSMLNAIFKLSLLSLFSKSAFIHSKCRSAISRALG